MTPTQEMMEDNNYNIWSASLWHGKNHNTMKTYYIKSKRQTNLIWTTCRKNCFRYLKPMSPLNAAICTTISYTLWVEWYYLKNNSLTLRSKVKVPQKSLRYATHHLMVMHPHTKYNWPIWKDKKVMVRRNFAEKKQKRKKQKSD